MLPAPTKSEGQAPAHLAPKRFSRSRSRVQTLSILSITLPSCAVPAFRFDGLVRVMPSLGAGQLPYASLQAAVLRDGCGVAAHNLGGQSEALVLQALYL